MWKDLPSNYKLFTIPFLKIKTDSESLICGINGYFNKDLKNVIFSYIFVCGSIYLQIINYLQFLF